MLQSSINNMVKRIETQNKTARHKAKLESLGEMASSIAHEVNNPLSVISVLLIKMKKRNKENAELSKSIDKMNFMVDRICKITSGLKSFFKKR